MDSPSPSSGARVHPPPAECLRAGSCVPQDVQKASKNTTDGMTPSNAIAPLFLPRLHPMRLLCRSSISPWIPDEKN